ncbi:hypothetical protein [Clostridium aminobutyricum]|uniref:Uncharacterized protein n=1 Tax=Clostridium aminobutyricum TaxID=33953 RepID=A0A939DB54_CLOAM|nr:hypothetical protein [Clostridium aminobutyricum]MBN7774602.1 hypothetical protein [Clostridium aminobutyricum]
MGTFQINGLTDDVKAAESTFIVKVEFGEDGSWKGNVQWVEGGEVMVFNNAMDLIKIIDNAYEEGYSLKIEGI